jgi:phosphoribosylformylglycinamidine synthase subunit PurQ / glutaminase
MGRFGIIVFPGSNCDRDCHHVLSAVLGQEVSYIWHADELEAERFDCVILPGGFSYGDYLRSGAMAKFATALARLDDFIAAGKYVLGICNGFQILLESGHLPGAMLRNRDLKFACDWVELRLENSATPFTAAGRNGAVYRFPIAHMDGSYYAPQALLDELEANGQIVFRYHGRNPNGSARDIAGICNRAGNVFGLMPHPERCSEALLGGKDGRIIFESLVGAIADGGTARTKRPGSTSNDSRKEI